MNAILRVDLQIGGLLRVDDFVYACGAIALLWRIKVGKVYGNRNLAIFKLQMAWLVGIVRNIA